MTKFLKKDDITTSWYEIDAKNAVVGRLATIISKIIRGKNKNTYTPHMDHGDYVIVKNIEKIHKDGLQFLSKNPHITKTRFLGGIAAFNILGFDKGYGARIGEKIKRNFLKKGYLIRPLGETIYLMPPFCIKEKILEKVYQDLDEEINKIKI